MAQSKSGKQKANNRIKAAGKEAEKQTQKDTAEQLAESWAERIRTAIDQSAMTDLDIAKEVTKRGISLSPRTIYNWKLNGGMSRDYIDPFCDVVGCDKLWMLTGESHQALQLVHSKEDISPGLQQRHHAIPLLETGDLMEVAERLDHVEDHDVGSSGWMRDRIEAWMDNPAATTEVYIPMLSGHRHEEVVPGIPRYCLQVSQADHDTPGHPWLWQGQLLGMATDVWPSRDEFAMFLRQPIHKMEPLAYGVSMQGFTVPTHGRFPKMLTSGGNTHQRTGWIDTSRCMSAKTR